MKEASAATEDISTPATSLNKCGTCLNRIDGAAIPSRYILLSYEECVT